MKWACLMLLAAAGCATAPAPRLAGLYQFPATAELHYPLFWLDEQGHFAFLADPAEAGGATNAPNSGTWQRTGATLQLRYQQAYCCQFANLDQEPLIIQQISPERVRVRFRDQDYELNRVPATP